MSNVNKIVILKGRSNCHLVAIRRQRHRLSWIIISLFSFDAFADMNPIALGIIHSIDTLTWPESTSSNKILIIILLHLSKQLDAVAVSWGALFITYSTHTPLTATQPHTQPHAANSATSSHTYYLQTLQSDHQSNFHSDGLIKVESSFHHPQLCDKIQHFYSAFSICFGAPNTTVVAFADIATEDTKNTYSPPIVAGLCCSYIGADVGASWKRSTCTTRKIVMWDVTCCFQNTMCLQILIWKRSFHLRCPLQSRACL